MYECDLIYVNCDNHSWGICTNLQSSLLEWIYFVCFIYWDNCMGFGDNMYNVVYQQCEKIFEAIYILVKLLCVAFAFRVFFITCMPYIS